MFPILLFICVFCVGPVEISFNSNHIYSISTPLDKKHRIGDDSRISMGMFFGFVGFWNLVLLWPFFFILHYTGLETFSWPPWPVVGYLTLNGLVGTVLSDWLDCVF